MAIKVRKSVRITEELETLLEKRPSRWTFNDIQSWIDEDPNWDTQQEEYTVLDIADAETPKRLNEASLGRIYQHYKRMQDDGGSFAILTSYRKALTPEARQKNKDSFKKLRNEAKKWGFFQLMGYGQEDDEATGEEVVVTEPSLFIVNIPFDDAMRLSKKYGQYGFQYAGPETDGNVWMVYTRGGYEVEGAFHPMKIAKYYSKMKKKPFVFESRAVQNETWMDGLAMHIHGLKEIPGIRRASKKDIKV